MSSATWNYLTNLLRLLGNRRLLKPLVISYCLTTQCNLNCRYCEDYGARRNAAQPLAPLPFADALRLLRILRGASDSLILTGGEPLLYPDIEPLLAAARRELHFRNLTLLTNGALLEAHLGVLAHLRRLVISLDTVDAALWDETLRAGSGTAQKIIATIAATAQRQPATGFRLLVNCVVTPETLPQARGVLDFCLEHGITFSFSPQSLNNWPHYALLVSNEYRAFVTELLRLKRQGAPILGSLPYLEWMRSFAPYACYPLLAPRVLADGTLSYPCRPIERGGLAQGGREINILDAGSWEKALAQAIALYGQPPSTCGSCYQQCYVEPSLMQSRPLALLWELLAYAPSRQLSLHTYAPG